MGDESEMVHVWAEGPLYKCRSTQWHLSQLLVCSRLRTPARRTLSLLVCERCAGALHVRLEELGGCDQAGLLSRREAGGFGLGAGSGTAADAGKILKGTAAHK